MIKTSWLERIGACICHGKSYLRKSRFDDALSGSCKHLLRNVYASYVTEFAHKVCKLKRRPPAAAANIEHVFSGVGICLSNRRVSGWSEKLI